MKKLFVLLLAPFFVNAHESLVVTSHFHFEPLLALLLTSSAAIFLIRKYFPKV